MLLIAREMRVATGTPIRRASSLRSSHALPRQNGNVRLRRRSADSLPSAAATGAGGGGGSLIDPSATAGRRRVLVPPQLNPAVLEDMRKTEAFGPRVSLRLCKRRLLRRRSYGTARS